MPLELECGYQYRIKKTGEIVETEICSVKESGAVLIFRGGVLAGVSGNIADKATATKLSKVIGKNKTEVMKITL